MNVNWLLAGWFLASGMEWLGAELDEWERGQFKRAYFLMKRARDDAVPEMNEHMSDGVSGCLAIEELAALRQRTATGIEMLD